MPHPRHVLVFVARVGSLIGALFGLTCFFVHIRRFDSRPASAYALGVEFVLKPALAAKVEQWSVETGRSVGDLFEDAVAGYFSEIGELRSTLDHRYDDLADGSIQLVDGAEAYRQLKTRAEERRKSIA